jgi:hypothetical protein
MILLSHIIPLLLIIYYHISKNGLEFEIKVGISCYSCGSILTNKDEYFNDLFIGKKVLENDNYKQCVSCNRNNNINVITKGFKYKIISNFKKFILSRSSVYLSKYLTYIIALIVILHITIFFIKGEYKIFILISNFLNSIFWLYNILKFKILTKKPH